MSDSLFAKSADRRTRPIVDTPPPQNEEIDDLGTFGHLRGTRDRAIMLELRLKDGNVEAVAYAWLERVQYNPSDGIALHYAGRIIRIRGRNLNSDAGGRVKLFQAITRHRVTWIQEADQSSSFQTPKDMALVDRIEI